MPERSDEWRPNGLCSLFVCDVASFGHPARSDLDRFAVRTALYVGLRRSFDGEGVPFGECYSEDRGDGTLLAVPPEANTSILLTTLLERLRAEVRRHNDVSATTARLRLRVAVHTGVVYSDAEGLVGTAVNHAFRLLEAEQLKLALRETSADVALIASERVYDDVIRHGLGLVDPGEYHEAVIRVKETVTRAWIRVLGIGTPHPAVSLTRVPVIDAQVVPPKPTSSGPLTLPAPVSAHPTVPSLDTLVDLALDIRQLRARPLRDQIVDELPLALTTAIKDRRAEGDRADISAIVRTCGAYPHGLHKLVRVVRQFVGNSTQVEELSRSIDALELE
jgi:Effector-associated domain 2